MFLYDIVTPLEIEEARVNEIKKGQKDANGYTRCWPGKHAEGTKKGKNGGQVRNCKANEGQLEFNTPDPVIVVQDLKGNILDKVNLSVAAQKYRLGSPQTIKNQLAHQNYTKVGNYMVVSPMGGQPQDSTTQSMPEGEGDPEGLPHLTKELLQHIVQQVGTEGAHAIIKSLEWGDGAAEELLALILKDLRSDLSDEEIAEHIGKVKGGYRLYSHKGKNLGTFPSRAGAEKHEREVQYFKHANEGVAEGLVDALKGSWEKIKNFDSPARSTSNTQRYQDLRKQQELKRKQIKNQVPVNELSTDKLAQYKFANDLKKHGQQGVAEGIFGSRPSPVLPIVNKIDKVVRGLTPQNVETGKQIIQSHIRDITRMLSPQDRAGVDMIEQGVAEAIPLDKLRSTGTRVKDEVSAKLKQNGPLGRDAEKAKQNGKSVNQGVAEGDMYGDEEVSWEKGGRRAPTGAFRNPAVVKTNKPIGTRVSDIGPGGKEYNVKTDKEWDKQKGVAEDTGDSTVAGAITRRILSQRLDLLKQYGPDLVGAAVDNVAEYVGDVDEIGTSDVSAWVAQVERMLKNNPPEAFAEDSWHGTGDSWHGAGNEPKDAWHSGGGLTA